MGLSKKIEGSRSRCRGEDEERNEEEEEGVEAQKKGGGSHRATHPRGTDIIWERHASGRGDGDERRARTGGRK